MTALAAPVAPLGRLEGGGSFGASRLRMTALAAPVAPLGRLDKGILRRCAPQD